MESAANQEPCSNCGQPSGPRFCGYCGEKRLSRSEQTLRYFLGQVINALTFTDQKLLRSLWLLFSKPGFLARAYVDGRRQSYTRPLALFFIGNLIYFLFLPVDTFNTSFSQQLHSQPYSSYIRPLAEQKAADVGMEDLAKRYNKRSADLSKMLLILLAFFFSLPVSLLFFKRSALYFHHLQFSLSIITFIIYGIFLLMPLLMVLAAIGSQLLFGISLDINVNESSIVIPIFLILIVYISTAVRRFYQQHWVLSVIKGLLLTLSFIPVLIGYKLLLFLLCLHLV